MIGDGPDEVVRPRGVSRIVECRRSLRRSDDPGITRFAGMMRAQTEIGPPPDSQLGTALDHSRLLGRVYRCGVAECYPHKRSPIRRKRTES